MTADRGLGNLPAETTSLVGRQAELAQLGSLIERSRLVTLTGVGGVGKTRLAVRAAAQVRTRFPGGVWLVALSPLDDGALLGHTIGEALGVVTHSLRSIDEVLCEYLAERRLLLIFDTCEHLVDTCAAMAEMLLDETPGVSVLATSRQPLEVAGEHVFVVDPLPVPGPVATGYREDAHDDAVALFADRAAAIVPGFSLTGQNRALAAVLCRRLEGLPLAIELAAARLRDLSIGQLVNRLHDRLGLLADVEHTPPSRHQTMRTTIGWSHELCEPLERLLWARLSVFAGDFDTDTAEKVCADERLPAASVVEVLLALVDKSILTSVHTKLGTRYRMLDTIREYGAGWLTRLGEEHDMRRRHRDHYLALARRGDAAWIGPDQVSWYDQMVAEHDNLRAALDFSLASRDGHTALEMAGALWFFWAACGFAKEGQHYLDRALALDPAPGQVRTKALWARGLVANTLGDPQTGLRLANDFQKAVADETDETTPSAAAYLEGTGLAVSGRYARAAEVLDAMPHSPPPGGRYDAAWFLARVNRTFVHIQFGELTDADATADELCAECARRGEIWARAWGDYMRALAALGLGRVEQAAAHARTALDGKRRLHDSLGIAMAIDLLASTAVAAGHAAHAARLLGIAEQVWPTLGTSQMGIPELVAARQACEQQARNAIGDQAYDQEYEAGYDADLEAGITYALSPPRTSPHHPADNGSTG